VVPTNFELDLKTILTHILGVNEIEHVSNKYLQDAEDWVEGAIAHALDDFHVSDININFVLVQEVDVKVGQTFNVFYLPVQQVSTIHEFEYVLGEHHGDYVSDNNMGIKQNCMPSKPLELD